MSTGPQPRRVARPSPQPPPAARVRPTRNLPPRKPFPVTLVATAAVIALLGILYFLLRPRPLAEPPPPPPRLNLSWKLVPKRCQIIGAAWYDLLRSHPPLAEICAAGLEAWMPWLPKAVYRDVGLCLAGAILRDDEPAEYLLLLALPQRLSEEEWQKIIAAPAETSGGQKIYRLAKGSAEGYAALLQGTVAAIGTRNLVLEAANLAKPDTLGISLAQDSERCQRAQEGMTQGALWAEVRMGKKRIAVLCDLFGVPPQKLPAEAFEHLQVLLKRKQDEVHLVGMIGFNAPDTAADTGRLIVGGLLGEWLGEEESPELIPAGKCLGIKCRLPASSLSALARRLRGEGDAKPNSEVSAQPPVPP
ncbi:MAG: hypothetical protein N3A66_10130 [Planctomycetota bacterium]|nr:hypothetical protein [Planctomycetota bacterium]